MHISNLLAMALGLVVTALGVLGLVAPSVVLELARSLQSTGALYVVAVIRVAFGAILLWAASNSRTPLILRILGVLIIIAGLATPFFGVDRSRALFEWWSTQGSSLARAWPIAAIGFGLFIAYTTSPRYAG
jgi:hypothetical protein